MSQVVSVILSGGSGSRLWPLSRKSHPKPYVQLPDGQTLIQKTLARILAARPGDPVLTVTNRAYYFLTRDSFGAQAGKAGSGQRFAYLLESVGRNILSGGSGSRLWPLSRKSHPKPYVPLPDGETLIQKTLTRVLKARSTDKVNVGDNEKLVITHESTFIPAGTQHRLSIPGVMDLALIEVQSGAYLGEDDVVRFDDLYGRVRAVPQSAS